MLLYTKEGRGCTGAFLGCMFYLPDAVQNAAGDVGGGGGVARHPLT